ncbi:hypothetical protein [Methylobacterium dankookense]|uniref:Uncharacterized protein n=1 Tax=Methylobacterium dankookense TaxID=560405 RepID=A0A564G588_9HYPH|nr:hypothetical protein [Methylobacterium dankookense]GJD57227.1 hypothetical protein IFDJLNFL_3128 [Methylobacterium dankookense]VUF15705.1 hypothetical protein MTDSW087_05449 [Methylobacterium dankookense]
MTMDEGDRIAELVQAESDLPLASMADFNEADYLPYLAGLELTDAQASELLRILWDMMRMCIEMDLPPESWGQITSQVFAAAARDSVDVE